MHRIILAVLLTCFAASAFGMGGAPVFIVGQKMTGMTVEGTHSMMELNSPSSTIADDKFSSDRIMLIARYGILPMVDISGGVGTASLNFKDLPSGYSDFEANWSLAWGADVRAGYPANPTAYQVVAAVKYLGFRAHGSTSNEQKTIDTKYLWHEISPTLTVGYVTGPVTPFVGVMKPFLFGTKDEDVTFNGQTFAAAGGKSNFADGEQSVRGLFGLEWRWPNGYSFTGEAAAASNGIWTVSLGISQVLK